MLSHTYPFSFFLDTNACTEFVCTVHALHCAPSHLIPSYPVHPSHPIPSIRQKIIHRSNTLHFNCGGRAVLTLRSCLVKYLPRLAAWGTGTEYVYVCTYVLRKVVEPKWLGRDVLRTPY